MYTHTYMYVYIYIYIYRERERHIYIYIYITYILTVLGPRGAPADARGRRGARQLPLREAWIDR